MESSSGKQTVGRLNTRQFDQAADLHTPGFFSHPLGSTGFEAGKERARCPVSRHAGRRPGHPD